MEYEMQHGYKLTSFLFVFILVILILFAVVFVFCENVLIPFTRKRSYIKMEMARSEGAEYLHWKRRLRRHYVRHIPFIGRFLVRFMR